MQSRILLSLSLLLPASPAASAQSADEFFHDGAQSYLSNNVARAREEVDKGLKLFPEDIKLKKLDELLKQQSQQQSKNDQQQEQQQKDQPQQGKQDKKEQPQGDKQSQEQKDKQQPEQAAKSSGEKKDNKDEPQPGEPSQPMPAHAMTPQEAKQLLDAQKGEEQVLQFRPPGEPRSRGRTLKDW
jgi:tRNA(Glu) U13 pseudouridine synthase TruD